MYIVHIVYAVYCVIVSKLHNVYILYIVYIVYDVSTVTNVDIARSVYLIANVYIVFRVYIVQNLYSVYNMYGVRSVQIIYTLSQNCQEMHFQIFQLACGRLHSTPGLCRITFLSTPPQGGLPLRVGPSTGEHLAPLWDGAMQCEELVLSTQLVKRFGTCV